MITYIDLKCDFCGKDVKRELSIYNAKIKYHKKKHHKQKKIFCSHKCQYGYNAQTNTITSLCGFCTKPVTRRKNQVKKSKSGKTFCNASCAAKFNNKLRRKSRRSKIEIKFYNLLVKEFPNLNILPNDKTMLDGSEVDVAIPSLKLAIEWNGIVHFKPIYGTENLDKVQKRDTEKLKIASNKDINLIVISDTVSNDEILQKSFEDCKKIINSLILSL